MADSANIETPKAVCLRQCSRTFRGLHGEALRGGPFPGTGGKSGDVRRCGHGRVWAYVEQTPFDYTIDHWELLSFSRDPVARWRAGRALRVGGEPGVQ